MAKQIVWHHKAEIKVDNILLYLKEKWASDVTDNFLNKFDNAIELIINHPESGRLSAKYKNVRSLRIGDYHRIYYRNAPKRIEILDVVDLRQNPIKNRFE